MARKTVKKSPVRRPVYLDPELHARLKAQADRNGQKLGYVAAEAITRYLRDTGVGTA